MNEQIENEIIGAWIDAIGTIIASLGVSPFYTAINFDNSYHTNTILTQKEARLLVRQLGEIGNSLQALGNGIEARTDTNSLSLIGNKIGLTGNLTVLYSLQPDTKDTLVNQLIILGNIFQALGAYLEGTSDLNDNTHTNRLSAYGNFTQTIGNSLQAYGGFLLLQNHLILGNIIIFIGSWIQTLGAILCAISASLQNDYPLQNYV